VELPVSDLVSFLNAHSNEIIAAVSGALAGATVSAVVTVKVMRARLSGGSNLVNQRGATAGGDNIGRDKIVRDDPARGAQTSR
jgi:hypothetical protein